MGYYKLTIVPKHCSRKIKSFSSLILDNSHQVRQVNSKFLAAKHVFYVKRQVIIFCHTIVDEVSILATDKKTDHEL